MCSRTLKPKNGTLANEEESIYRSFAELRMTAFSLRLFILEDSSDEESAVEYCRFNRNNRSFALDDIE